MLGINGGEFIVLALLALAVIGPERLPQYASQLAGFVREARRFAVDARAQVREELGPDFDDVDWRKLDPRQYDPRRIVRDALSEAFDDDEPDEPVKRATRPGQGPGGRARRPGTRPLGDGPAPFDPEAT